MSGALTQLPILCSEKVQTTRVLTAVENKRLLGGVEIYPKCGYALALSSIQGICRAPERGLIVGASK